MREWFNRLSRVARAARGVVEPLEPRQLLCYGPDVSAHPAMLDAIAAGAPGALSSIVRESTVPSAALSAAPLNPSGLPLLHSLPGGRTAVFLDFDGFATQYTPFDTDGVSASFSPPERADIDNTWRHVASYFSMFALDVTTEQPPPGTPLSYSVISNSVLTVAYNSGSFPSALPINFHPAADAASRPTALAHEIGHSFGLMHQGTFDRRGKLVSEYSEGYDALHGSLMGVDFARDVQKWFIGHPSNSSSTLQDEVATIAAGIRAVTGGDGFRLDDVPETFEDAVSLTADGQGRRAATGIIERMNDADAYSFESAGGGFRIDVVPPAPSMLDAKVEVYASDGSLVAAADAATNDQRLVLPWLAEGTYYAVVKSHGNYGDLGPYDLSVQATVGVAPEAPPGGAPAPPATRVELGEGTGVHVGWDAVAGAADYVVERSNDGATWQQVGDADGTATTFDDAPPLGGHRYFYRVSAVGAAGRSAPSSVVHVVNRAAPPADVSVSFVDVGIILNWRDTCGETGYRVYRRTQIPGDEPGPWIMLAELGKNVPSVTDLSLPAARCGYRVAAVSADGEVASSMVIGGTTFSRVTGMRAAVPPGTHAVRVDWDRVPFGVGYVVERATDGVDFARVADVTTNSYTDADLAPARQYFYRVVGFDDLGFSKASGSVSAVTPGAPLPAQWSIADVGDAALGAVGTGRADAVAYQEDSGAFSVVGGGAGLFGQSTLLRENDSFRFVHTTLTGDGSITARVVPVDIGLAGLAGLMFRDGLEPDAPYVFAGTSPHKGRIEVSRPSGAHFPYSAGGPTTVRILRRIDTFYVYEQVGTTWQERRVFGVAMGQSVQVGMVCAAGSEETLAFATFENVQVVTGVPPAPPRLTSAAARPAVVPGDQSELFVAATDERGEGTLVYHWSLESGPPGVPAPELSVNHSNAAKSAHARFFGAGPYIFRVTVTNAHGLSVESTVAVSIIQTMTSVAITPGTAVVRAGESFQFTAAVLDQFGGLLSSSVPRRWHATYGRIDTDGRYTAPPYETPELLSLTVDGWWGFASVVVYDDARPALLSVVSRKVHAGRGAVDLPLALYGAPAMIEPRRGGPTTLVLTFSGDVVDAGGSLDADDFTIVNASFRSARIDGKVLTIELQDVRDRSRVSVRVNGLAGPGGGSVVGNTTVEIQALYGDATRDGAINAADIAALRTRTGRRGGPSDLLYDLDLDGVVSASDQAAARRRIVSTAPTAPQPAPAPRAAPARRSAY